MSIKEDQHQDQGLENIEHALSASEQFIEKYQKHISIGVMAIIAIAILFMGYRRYILQPKEDEAAEQMFTGEQYFAADSFRLALSGDGNFLGFEYIADEFGGTKAGNLAKFYAGVSYMHLGDFEKALDYLNSFSKKGKLVAPVAVGAKGDCHMELGEYKKAASYYTEAAEMKNDLTSPIYFKKAGTAYLLAGDKNAAVKAYKTVKEDYKNSPEARDIDKYIQRAEK